MKYWLLILLFLTGCASARPWTKEEKSLLVASCIASIADITTTLDGLHDGNSEMNPIMGKYPSDTRVISTMVTSQVLTIIIAHYLDSFRSLILGTKTGINTSFALHNLKVNK